jgi:hypothetical protein
MRDLARARVFVPHWRAVRRLRQPDREDSTMSLPITAVVKDRYFVAHARAPRPGLGEPWVDVSWLFFLEPLTMTRCRFISRYRCAMSTTS